MNRPGAPRFGSGVFVGEPASGAQPVQVSRFVRETLEAYASESIADEVLRSGLSLARLDALPSDSATLRELIEVHLFQATTAVLGVELAEEVRGRLLPLLAIVAQLEVARGEPDDRSERITMVGDTTPPPPGVMSALAEAAADPFDDRTPTRELELRPFSVVLVAGRQPDVATEIKQRVDARTAVIPVDEPARLLRDLRVLRTQPRMLIVDLRMPHGLLDALRGEPGLLDGAVVLLWGASRELDAQTKEAFATARIVRCSRDASLADLAAVVRLGPGR